MTAVGVYEGNDPATVNAFESWFGSTPDFIRGNGGRANWTDLVDSLSWLGKQFSGLSIPIYWTVSMFPKGYTLAEGATGAYDSYYVQAARNLLAASSNSDVIYVRVGEEFNGYWNPWSAQGKEQDFIATYRHFVDSFRSVSDKFRFEWNVNIGESMDPAKAYPGDAYVDIIGMDFYYYIAWNPKDPAAAFDHMVNERYGLKWLEDFATLHGKPTAYSEWGIDSDASVYIEKVAEWFSAHNVLYQSYWDSNSGYQGRLSSGQYATAGQAYKDAFSHPTTVQSSVDYTLTGSQKDLVLTGASAIDGTGNDLGNSLTGNGGSNVLDGKGGNDILDGGRGADRMIGGFGNDVFVVDNGGDLVVEDASAGGDTVHAKLASYVLPANVEGLVYIGTGAFTGKGNDLDNTILGGSGKDALDGKAGNDVLNGGAGADTLVGDFGDDTFVVDNVGDVVTEVFGAGTDTVQTSLSAYTLGKNVENLRYTGSNNFAGTGNTSDNVLTGGAGNDTLDGGSGADTLVGGSGNDSYIVDNAGDVVVEATSAGTDTILSRVTTTLPNNVETLRLTTVASISGTGNALDNTIVGNDGVNILDGGAGRDVLSGLGNNDTFVFRKGQANGDVVTDFSGAGVAKGDVLKFVGYGNGTLTHGTDPAHPDWYVITPDAAHGGAAKAETLQITGVTNLDLLTGGAHDDILFA